MQHADVTQHRTMALNVIAKCRESAIVMLIVLAKNLFVKNR